MVKKVGKWHVKGNIFKEKLRLSCVLACLRAKGSPSLLFHANQAAISSLAFSSTSMEA